MTKGKDEDRTVATLGKKKCTYVVENAGSVGQPNCEKPRRKAGVDVDLGGTTWSQSS